MANPRIFLNGVDLSNQKAINVASPTAATDAANKAYVDALLSGLEWKQAVRAATTTNGTLATAYANGQTIDGITLATGDRILIKDQTTQTENGIYTVNSAGAPTRSTDANTSAGLNNATVLVLQGTVNADKAFTQTTVNPTIGSSNIVFVQFGAGTVYTASNGVQLVTNNFSILLDTNPGLSVSGSGLKVSLGSNPALTTTGGLAVLLNGTNPALTTTGGLAVIAGTGITTAGNSVAIDTSVVARKFSQSIGNGALTTFAITHGLATSDVVVQVYDNSSLAQVETDVVHTNSTTVTLNFTVAPTSNQYRVVVLG